MEFAEALTCSPLLLPHGPLPSGHRRPRAGQPLPLTALPSPRTTGETASLFPGRRMPASCAPWRPLLLALGGPVRRVDHPQVSSSKRSGSLPSPGQFYSVARSGMELVTGQVPVRQLYVLGDACTGCSQGLRASGWISSHQ